MKTSLTVLVLVLLLSSLAGCAPGPTHPGKWRVNTANSRASGSVSGSPSRSVVNVKENYVYYAGNLGVTLDCNTAGTATGNFGDVAALATFAPGSVFSGNSLTLGTYGVYVGASDAKVESNHFYNSGWPVFLYSDGAMVTGNKFMGGGPLNFNCFTATVKGNSFIAGSISGIGGADTKMRPRHSRAATRCSTLPPNTLAHAHECWFPGIR